MIVDNAACLKVGIDRNCADGRACSCNLVEHIGAFGHFYIVNDSYDALCQFKRKLNQFILGHNAHSLAYFMIYRLRDMIYGLRRMIYSRFASI